MLLNNSKSFLLDVFNHIYTRSLTRAEVDSADLDKMAETPMAAKSQSFTGLMMVHQTDRSQSFSLNSYAEGRGSVGDLKTLQKGGF